MMQSTAVPRDVTPSQQITRRSEPPTKDDSLDVTFYEPRTPLSQSAAVSHALAHASEGAGSDDEPAASGTWQDRARGMTSQAMMWAGLSAGTFLVGALDIAQGRIGPGVIMLAISALDGLIAYWRNQDDSSEFAEDGEAGAQEQDDAPDSDPK